MPRGSTATKRQQGAANQRDTRHENGLVGPGKPVRKQKSHGHLNGHAKSSDVLSSPPILPADGPATNGHAKQTPSGEITTEFKMPREMLRRVSVGAYSESSSSESYSQPPTLALGPGNHRQIDVNSTKNPAGHRDAGNLGLAVTVLRSMPLADTIAILILLLQLPPAMLSIVHALFVLLTIVLPTFGSGDMNLATLFERTTAAPSLYVVILVWVVLMVLYWSTVSESPHAWFWLEFAQSIIALTLGGSSSGKEASFNKALACMGIAGTNHFVSRRGSKRSSFTFGLSSLTHGLFGSTDPDDPLESRNQGSSGHPGKLQYLLALYIIAQGLTKWVRDWIIRKYKLDPEATKGHADADGHISHTPDAEIAITLPFTNTATTIKRRKKQSAQLRIQQPVWSALASTKITMVKEIESSTAAAEFAGTGAVDASHLGNALFHEKPNSIWLTHVGHDSVRLSASYFPTHAIPQHSEESIDSDAIDRSKPFYVRVNSSVWQPTQIWPVRVEDQPPASQQCWEVEIPGLNARSEYKLQFVSTKDDGVIYTTSVTTVKPSADTVTGPPPKPIMGARPGSPKETLKNSIVIGEKRLSEDKGKLKRERKDHRSRINTVRRDIDKLNSSISSSGGSDDKLRQKIQQSKTHMKQAEDDFKVINTEIESLSITPIVDPSQYEALKSAYRSEIETHKKLHSDFNAGNQVIENELQSLKSDLASQQQKKEKIQARIVKLNGDLARTTDANARGLNEAQRIANDREAKNLERLSLQQDLDETEARIAIVAPDLERLAVEVTYLAQVEAQAEYMGSSVMHSSPAASNSNLPYGAIPEGNVTSGTSNYPWNPVPAASGIYSPSPYGAGMMNASASAPSPYRRGRSSSMLSNVSGFTQSSSGEPISYPPYIADEPGRKNSSGSASVSGSGSAGSVGDPKSPIGNPQAYAAWGSKK